MTELHIDFSHEGNSHKKHISFRQVILFAMALGIICLAIANGVSQDIIKTLITSILK